MEHITKQFTVIDFLGFLVPGAALTLALQWYYGGMEAPFERFFGEGSPFLAVYFLTLSYLLGIILHEAGRSLNLFFPSEKQLDAYWRDGALTAAYEKIFGVSILAATKDERKFAGRRSVEYIQGKDDPGKMRTFSAFAAMSRTLIITLAVILWIIVLNDWTWFTRGRVFWTVIIFAILISNWRHYVNLRTQYAYTLFLSTAKKN